jgi:small GTP-binding protein
MTASAPLIYPSNSLCLRFVTNQFRPYSEATIGASFMSKTIIISGRSDDDVVNAVNTAQLNAVQVNNDERQIGFKIWDTAGQEKYRSLAPMYYRGSQAAILVYDITKPASLESLKDWANELRRNGPSDLVLAVCGNKLDLQEDRLVMRSAGEKYAKQIGALNVETSAKEGDDVERLFVEIARKVPPSKHEDDYLAEDLDLSKPVVKSGGCC